MAHCFQLVRDGQPVTLNVVDEELCAHLGEEVHPTNWCANWYNIEGLGFACGMPLEKIRELYPTRSHIHDFLEKFTIDTWRE